MAIFIVSGADGVTQLTVDPTSNAARVSQYDTAGNRTNLAGLITNVCNTGVIAGATATGLKSLSYLWHPNTSTRRNQILRVHINQIAGSQGTQRLELYRIAAENATPGGTTGTIFEKDSGDAASLDHVQIAPTGAPTRSGAPTPYLSFDFPVGLNGNADIPPIPAIEGIDAKPYILRVSQNEGYEVVQNVISTISTAPSFNITWEWTEL